MRRMIWAGASLMMLAACGTGPNAVGENSADSIKTTAVGEVVANIASPTPTPTPTADADVMSNDSSTASPNLAADNAVAE